jgi:predicted esterase
VRTIAVETTTHGRVLVEDAARSSSGRLLVAFHGYGQNADEMLSDVRAIPGASGWQIISVQALHRFYTRNDQGVVASWMTRQDREHAIADNILYVDRVIDIIRAEGQGPRVQDGPIVFLGFSQGVAMAYRSAVLGRHRAAGLIALAGEIPPEISSRSGSIASWPRVLIGVGSQERWYVADELNADVSFLKTQHVDHQVVRFNGGHEWTTEFRTAAGKWLEKLARAS